MGRVGTLGAIVDDCVRQLASDSGALRRIAGRRSAAGYDSLELIFDRGILRLTCEADTDEIVVDVISGGSSEFEEIRDAETLVPLIGKVIEQAWTMVNDRGYRDAFQVRCIDLATRSESCCHFEVAASAITVARVGA